VAFRVRYFIFTRAGTLAPGLARLSPDQSSKRTNKMKQSAQKPKASKAYPGDRAFTAQSLHPTAACRP
jgi:hypothetical protein